MTAIEKCLLENALDALDRLFDRDSTTVDVWALLVATSEALRATQHYSELVKPTAELLTIIRSNESPEAERDHALEAPDKLRHYLAGQPIN